MAMKHTLCKTAFVLTSLGLAFWVGRVSSPDASDKIETTRGDSQVSERSPRKSSGSRRPSGAGESTITSVSQLRDFYKYGEEMEAKLVLAKMNGDELSMLAQGLAKTYTGNPSYLLSGEIRAVFIEWAEVDTEAALEFALSSKQQSFRHQAVRCILLKLAKSDPERALAKLSDVSDPSLSWRLKKDIYSSMATLQPEAWIQAVRADATLAHNISIASVAARWAMDDPSAAAARIQMLPFLQQRQGVEAIGKSWAATDPQAAMVWAQSFSTDHLKNKAMCAVVGGMAVNDPDGALAALEGMGAGTRRTGVAAIFRALVNTDFDSALAKASALSNPADQKTAFDQILSNFNHYSGFDVAQIETLIKQLPSAELKKKALVKLGGQMANLESQEVASSLKGYSEKDQLEIQRQMIDGLQYLDPMRALEIYQSMPRGRDGSYMFSNIVKGVARVDPERALQLVLKEKSSYQQARAAGSVFTAFAEQNPENATQHLKSLPEGQMRNKALTGLARTWAKADPEAAVKWASTLEDGEKNKALLTIIPKMSESSPEDAAIIMESMLASSTEKSQSGYSSAIHSVIRHWGDHDPAAAGSWAQDLEDGQAKTYAMRALAPSWYEEDSEAVADWIDQLPPGKNRDTSISSIASNIQRKDPSIAFAWGESIGDGRSRIESLSSIIRSWKKYDEAAARETVEKADLSAEEQERLLKYFDQ